MSLTGEAKQYILREGTLSLIYICTIPIYNMMKNIITRKYCHIKTGRPDVKKMIKIVTNDHNSQTLDYNKYVFDLSYSTHFSYNRILAWRIQPYVTKTENIQGFNRKEEVIIHQLKLGKCKLNYHQHISNQHEDGLCIHCMVQKL